MTGAVNLSTPDMDDLPRHAYAKQDKDYPVVLLSIRALQKVIDLRGGQVDRPLKVRGSRVHDLV